ncbi:SIMPL domain-containing protein [Alteriqipengyuania flavescens]|uniref:SIMPL domain-containing protein n=1 Tax=Alteriqipengyuania flavescens TaxID=3053610 RepID=UPI0025B4A31C|nr:SIMPL domain-containing protein [Alteriqipengyuania flavescens]WJY18625.1 SIMPL domain-containing protein [Alteriqipengyuania flavescens]WJY24565.1 SIMPL domain-containing protein [Alteriqipengyuania flavescens]
MLRYALPLFASAALFASPAAAQVQVQTSGPVVELDVLEVVEVEPDIVTLSAGVTTLAPTAVEALEQNSAKMRQVVARLKTLGIAERDIQTSSLNLNPRFDFNPQTNTQDFRGYQVANRVTVTLRKVDRAGEALDALVREGATDFYGPNFGLDDDTAAKTEARANAIRRGQDMAREYARAAGYRDVRLLRVAESVRGREMFSQERAITVSASDVSSGAPPIEPGVVGIGVQISVSYEMVN